MFSWWNTVCCKLSGGTETNATARSNLSGDARTPGIGGLGGLGLPDMPPMLNGMPDASQLTQLLQNPALSQMTQSIASNPQYMNQVLWSSVKSLSFAYFHFFKNLFLLFRFWISTPNYVECLIWILNWEIWCKTQKYFVRCFPLRQCRYILCSMHLWIFS